MRQPFGSYSQYNDDEVLNRANFDDPYGVLEYSHAELNNLPTDNLSVAMQKALAETFARSYGARSRELMEIMPFTPERQIQNEFLKSLVDISGIGNARVGDQTFGQLYPSLNSIQTYGDIANVLFASNSQGILSAAKQAAGRRKDFGPSIGSNLDIYNQGATYFYDALFSYEPGRSEFTKYAQGSVFTALSSYYRDQAGIARMQGGSLENLVNPSPDTTVDEGVLNEQFSLDASGANDFRTLSKRSFRQNLENRMLGFGNTPGGIEYPAMYQQTQGQGGTEYRGGSSANTRMIFPTGLVTNDPGEAYYNNGELVGYSPFVNGQMSVVKPWRGRGNDSRLHRRKGYPVAVTAMDYQALDNYKHPTAEVPSAISANVKLLDQAFSKINWNLTNASGANDWVEGMGSSPIEIADAEWNAASREVDYPLPGVSQRVLPIKRKGEPMRLLPLPQVLEFTTLKAAGDMDDTTFPAQRANVVNYTERFNPNDDTEVMNYASTPHSSDPTIIARWKADAVRNKYSRRLAELEGSEGRMTTDSVHASAARYENDLRYMAAVGRLNAPTDPNDADWGNASAQIQVRGSSKGFNRRDKITAYMSPTELAKSTRDYKALKAAGVFSGAIPSLPSGMEDDMEFRPTEENPFAPGEGMPDVRPARRRVGSDIGNTPEGVQAWGENTPSPRRRSDGLYQEDEPTKTYLGKSARSRSGGRTWDHGNAGGGSRNPPPPNNDDPFGPEDMSGDDPGDFGDQPGGGPPEETPHSQRRSGDYVYTPTPNSTIAEGLERGSFRTSGYNPSINPKHMATRAFGKRIARDARLWANEMGWEPEEIAQRSSEMFDNFLAAEAAGVGNDYINSLVPERLRSSFESAARQGSMAFERVVGFAKKASPVGVTEYFNNLENAPLGPNPNYDHPVHGMAGKREVVNSSTGEVTGREDVLMRGDQVNIGPELIHRGVDITRQGLMNATASELPSEPGSAMATIRARVSSIINKHVEDFGKAMEGNGATKDDVQKATTYLKDAATKYLNDWSSKASENLNMTERPGDANARQAGDLQHAAKKFANVEDARATMENRPRLRAQVEEYQARNGLSLEQMMEASGDGETIFQDGDMAFQFGGPGRGRGEGGADRGRGMWRGAVGTAMYGAYIGQRMWKMGMGATMQAAGVYGQYASDIGKIASPGMNILAGESGYAARQTMGQIYEGRGAYQEFGAFMDLPFYMAASGDDASGRLLATAKAAGTTGVEFAIGGAIASQMAGQPGLVGTAAAKLTTALPWAGAIIGGGMLLGAAGMELYNAANPDKEKLTFSNIFEKSVEGTWRAQATQKYLADQKAAPGSQSLATFLWNKVTGKDASVSAPPTDEDLRPYLTDAQYGAMNPIKNPDVEAAIKSSERFITYGLDETQSKQATQMLFAASGVVPTKETIDRFGTAVQTFGTSAISDAAQYAQNMGFTPGTEAYLNSMAGYSGDMSVANRYRMTEAAGRNAQIASQISPYMSPYGGGSASKQLASVYGITTQQQASSWQRLNNTASQFQKTPITEAQQERLVQITANSNPYQAAMISDFGGLAGAAGRNVTSAMEFAGLALPSIDFKGMSAFNSAVSGDIRGLSYAANHGLADNKWGLFDNAGNSITERYGVQAMDVASRWGSTGLGWITGGAKGQGSLNDMASRFLGGGASQETINAFMQNGTRGIQSLANETSYQASMASAGIQMRQIALQEQYLWGGGSWSNPDAGSMWGLQDQQRQMQYGFQTADFNARENQMRMANNYSILRENNQYQRMSASQGFNLWQMDFSRSQSLQQRQWTQDDYQYQDTTRGLNFEWQMTDLNENIRFASGRDRRQLVRQRDRAALSFNLEDEQIDTQRGRQKEVWAAEDERFKKQKSYTIELNELDKQSFELNKSQRVETYRMEREELARSRKERDEAYALDTQMIALEREHQAKSLELQKEAAGVQAWAAQKQHEYQIALEKAQQNWGDLMGSISNDMNYDPAMRFQEAMNNLMQNMRNTGTTAPTVIGNMVVSLGNLDLTKIARLIDLIREINMVN